MWCFDTNPSCVKVKETNFKEIILQFSPYVTQTLLTPNIHYLTILQFKSMHVWFSSWVQDFGCWEPR
jgi:hypothetical protein